MLADPFEVVLRSLSREYLRAAWEGLLPLLRRHRALPDDLSWGCLHPGETHIPGFPSDAPGNFVGWSSRQLGRFYEDPRCDQLDAALCQDAPLLRCAATWRSLKWTVAPDDFALALRLIEAWTTDEIAFWDPDSVLWDKPEPAEAWLKVAQAVRANDQHGLDRAVAEAKTTYSPLGYRIIIRAYTVYIGNPELGLTVWLPYV